MSRIDAHTPRTAKRPPSVRVRAFAFALLMLALAGVLAGCAGTSSSTSGGKDSQGTTSGPVYAEPSQVLTSVFNAVQAQVMGPGRIDLSQTTGGIIGVQAESPSRMKLQVTCGSMSYNYDLPQDGTPIIVPVNMGSGTYELRMMQNTSGNNYAQLDQRTVDIALESEFIPFLRPNLFCDYTAESACVAKARELAANAQNEGDVVRDVYDWMVSNIAYDAQKAERLSTVTGYIPNPDQALAQKTGICFDYASLAAAMFRSLGIPCKIITGYVSPDDIYHAWNLIYIDGSWVTAAISVEADQWCRVDLTFAAAGANNLTVGDGTTYTDRYVY